MSQETYEETFTVGELAKLRVRNIRGSVEVRPGEEGSIHVKAVKHLDNGNPEDSEVRIEQLGDGTVEARSEKPEEWYRSLHPCKVDFFVEAPKTCDIDVKTVSAATSVEGFQE